MKGARGFYKFCIGLIGWRKLLLTDLRRFFGGFVSCDDRGTDEHWDGAPFYTCKGTVTLFPLKDLHAAVYASIRIVIVCAISV